MSGEDRIERARTLYEQAVYGGDAGALADAERDLDAVEADTALARGRILHARFLDERARSGSSPAEDPAELPLFERASELYQALGDPRGEAEALFWIGCLYQVIRRDNETAVPLLERSRRLAARSGDRPTEAEALRHLGIAAHMAGRLDEARERLEESSRLRRELGALPGVAANLVGLAYIAAAQDRHADARAALDEAHAIARAHGAHAVVRQIEQARTEI
ncbi:tetratricopeptide repeat protein [Dactylosporangium sp. NPDC051541]|uniref:tetratricopeptide repeat protein n=1 Tax=Dactylosporangium sp. NPDC051541 TaxID=3363977 RepID=UPI0037B0D645